MKNLTNHWKLPAILCASVVAMWVAYLAIAGSIFNGDLAKSGQFGDTFGALNTLFTGLAFAVVLATLIRQWHQIQDIKRDSQEERRFRLRLDLYDRRFRIYQAVSAFIGNAICDNVGQQQMIEFDVAHGEALFLFSGDDDLLKHLADLRQKAQDYANWRSQAKGQGLGSPASKQRDQMGGWLQDQLDSV